MFACSKTSILARRWCVSPASRLILPTGFRSTSRQAAWPRLFPLRTRIAALRAATGTATIAVEKDEASFLSGVRAVVEAMRQRGRLFVALVRYVGGKTLDREDWLALDPGLHVALLLAFADRLTQIMAPPEFEG